MYRLILLLALVIAMPCQAAGESDALTAQLSRRLSQRMVLRADFVQEKQMVSFKKPLIARGRMTFARDQGVIWRTDAPLRITYVISEDRIVEIGEDGKAQVRTARDIPGLAQVGRIFRALLGAQTAPLAELFTVSAENAPERWKLTLLPKPGPLSQYMKRVLLTGASQVERIRIEESSGDSTTITFSNPVEDDRPTPEELATLGRK